jgi:DNA-directed RNA polymerase II subunit RPB2
MDESIIWNLIDKYFKENPNCLVEHHLESFNDFYKNQIFKIFKENNPLRINSNYDEEIDDYRNQCLMYFGGKDGDKLYFGKPIIYDDNDNVHYMYPNEARLRNMTYGMTIHYDIDVEYIDILRPGETPTVIGGGNDFLELHEETFHDYPSEPKFSNFKTGGYSEENENKGQTAGGAPKKITRTKRVQREYKITSAMSTAIREATEKSMISPNTQRRIITIEKVYLGKFPIMVQSDFCILRGLNPDIRHTMGECRQDLGGYFIIQGKEKTVVPQEVFADNMLYIRKMGKPEEDEEEVESEYLYSAEIRSVSENAAKPIRTLSVKIVAPTKTFTFKNIVVNIPNVRKPVPLFIVFRALGILSDKSIIETCLLDLEKYEHMIDLFIPSVHDAGAILTQRLALEYIASLTKGKRIEHALEILSDYFLPHVGEVNFMEKAYYLGHIVFRLLSVYTGLEQPTDRDNFKYKRVELVGTLMYQLFREYYNIEQKFIRTEFDKRLTLNQNLYANDLPTLIQTFHNELFDKRLLEDGFKKAFKGNWGATAHSKRIGVVQDLNRLSFNSYLSHLRKTNLPLDSSVKLVGPRVLHCSQWGFIDPIDTPDGGNIGLHKSLAITTYITRGGSGYREPFIRWLRENISLKYVQECSPKMLSNMTKVIVNGYWAGSILDPFDCVRKMKLFRRNALLPIYTSITFDIKTNTVYIYTDGGRLCRPIFYKDEESGKLSYEYDEIQKLLNSGEFSWKDLIAGFNNKRDISKFNINNNTIYELHELYEGINSESNPAKLERFISKKAIIDYIDSSESENILIAINQEEYPKKNYTHLEIHESLIFGNMCNLIIFPENNPPTRNSFSCGQSKQACSMYHTNFQVRMDKTAVVLNNGQIPLVKSRFMEHINHEENPYGENLMVAIMCYTGYNMEDSILVNEGALKRGMFNTTYYTTYESHEEINKTGDVIVESKFTNIESESNVVGTKPGYDYSRLDKYGLIREGTEVDDKTVLIGITTKAGNGNKVDGSKAPKKGQLGIVDKTFMSEGEEGERISKVRIREIRIPNLGDKMASRAGQKGTVGLVIPECDMPFTRDGLRPDIIINPHAIPSRMTIGQLVECITGKACSMYGGFGDCTAFINKGSKIGIFGEMLTQVGFHSSGNEVLYNGMTGQQLESEIFIGPTYYMRLKHMVKDKINYRARGPNAALTRQPVSGRANDGGLRIGEMERDSVISHGTVNFLTESMMERGDKYYMAVCNTTGLLAVYNPSKNIFISPMADGPLRFIGSLDGKDMNIENITRFGRDFSVVAIPYSLKLLIQELQTINVQMRIITEDNIQQLENMSFSKNIEKLTGFSTINQVSDDIKLRLRSTKQPVGMDTPENIVLPQIQEEANEFEYIEGSPDYPNVSPAYESEPGEVDSNIKTNSSPPFNPFASSEKTPESEPLPETVDYKEGEIVYYRGDTQPQEWFIRKIGNNTITIQKRIQGEINPETDIKVVEKKDIYRPGDVVYAPRTPSITPENVVRGGELHDNTQMSSLYPQSLPSSINFAPVITVVGNDNKGDIVPPANNTNTSSVPDFNELVISKDPIKKDTLEQVSTTGVLNEHSNGAKNVNDNATQNIDFSNLVIKKSDS